MATQIDERRSGMFSEMDYDPQSLILTLTFRNGGAVAIYHDVPERVFNDFASSGSMGSYWHQRIKGVYK